MKKLGKKNSYMGIHIIYGGRIYAARALKDSNMPKPLKMAVPI
jgi:hypothetical protein